MGFVRICFIILIENGVKAMYNGVVYLQSMCKKIYNLCMSKIQKKKRENGFFRVFSDSLLLNFIPDDY